jgi:probable HAF family extracellular repeat protein
MTASICSASSATFLRPALRLCVAAAVLWAAAAHALVPSFSGVGDLSGGAVGSAANAVSADGQVVVGESEGASGTEAFRWTPGGGITGLGFLSGASPYSTALGVSDGGSVVVGTSNDASGVERAYRWSGAMTALDVQGCTDCDPLTHAYGVSGDGLVVVGSSVGRGGSTATPHLDPVRWPGGGTALSDLGDLSGGEAAGEAFGASQTGSTIAGAHFSANGKDAFYWQGSGLVALPTITGGSIIAAMALAVSDDASTIVGYTNASTVVLPGGTEVATDLQAVSWSGPGFGTLTQLGSFPGAVSTDSRALAVSSDGSVIVGTAKDVDVVDRAFIWDAANGMRDLKAVLSSDYGLDLSGWVLSEATGISDVVSGEFSVVGRGINPQGDPEGWIAVLVTPACRDGSDNDSDTFTDHPADPGCTSPVDWSEEADCNDGIDNDGDGQIDYPADGGCTSAGDPTEQRDCSDGLDNDGDGLFDFPADPGCASVSSAIEDPACSNGLDDDLDLDVDHPADAQCLAPSDLSETEDCSDGLDNDEDGLFDFPADPECESALDQSEASQCSDGIDNDANGLVDYPEEYPACSGPADPIEAPQCDDGIDNDLDGQIDLLDADCASPDGVNESPVTLSEGDLVAVDRFTRAVFRVDTGTGVQTLISEKASLQEPQGVARRGAVLVVADPVGLVEVGGDGVQRIASAPLVSNESLQVVIDDTLDAYVLEASEISVVSWNPTGLGAKSTWLAIPTPEPLPLLGIWDGDSLAREASGDFVTTGLSIYGDGVYRITSSKVVSALKGGFDDVRWLDLAVEGDGTILAAGYEYGVGVGVYRVDPATGVFTPLNNSYGWQMPTGVAVGASGDIYVADAGVCADGSCTGGEIVRVDPFTGAVTPLASGGWIGGELDLTVLPEPAGTLPWASALIALAGLARRRGRRSRPCASR